MGRMKAEPLVVAWRDCALPTGGRNSQVNRIFRRPALPRLLLQVWSRSGAGMHGPVDESRIVARIPAGNEERRTRPIGCPAGQPICREFVAANAGSHCDGYTRAEGEGRCVRNRMVPIVHPGQECQDNKLRGRVINCHSNSHFGIKKRRVGTRGLQKGIPDWSML